MSKFKKLLSLVIAVLVILSVFAGCGANENTVSTGGTYTYWVTMDTNVANTMTSFNEHPLYKEMENRLGIDVEFIHPSAGNTGSEAFQVLLASEGYPDMIEHFWDQYPGGGEQAIKDGVIISLNDYMEKYAPNYYDLMEGEKGKENGYRYRADAITNDGNYFGFKSINVGRYKSFSGLYVRKDLLDKWGLDIPTTLDEWETVFKTAKENGIKYPLTGSSTVLEYFTTPYKIANEYYIDGSKVKFGPFQPEYKEYLEKMADWMKNGYIDIDYVTNNSTTIHGAICNGTSIAAAGAVGGDLGKILPAMAERDPNFELVACPAVVMKKGETPYFQAIQASATERSVTISVQCGAENKDRYIDAIRWCDYLYSDEGLVLKCFGIEGDTFTVEKDENGDEHYVYTDKITDWRNSDIGVSNISASLYHYVIPANHPGYNQHMDYFKGYYEDERQMDAVETWNKYLDEAYKHVFPTVSYTGEEAGEKAQIEAAGKDNLKAAVSNIILGKASIDTFDDVVKAAKKAGYDRLTKINQEAYNRYKANLK